MRKRVVEYDDVINKQRETIYAERDKVLHNEDLTDPCAISGRGDRRRWSTNTSLPSARRLEHRRPLASPGGHGLDAAAVLGRCLWDLGSRDAIVEPSASRLDLQLERQAAESARRPGRWSNGSCC
jgi:hypothetical protein